MPERLEYRADVEGLRGIAILLVVLFHAGVTQLSGGFVAVDVFFVLSGYFTTALIFREIESTGGIALPEFYGRRAVRLLPTLMLVLLATIAIVMTLYAPIDRARIAETARSVAFGSSNLHFASAKVDYFTNGSNPLLHTWSLAVEEQFYLVWPLLFLATIWLVERRRAPGSFGEIVRVGRTPMAIAMGAAGLASLAACAVITTTSQPWAFFGIFTRVWEFAAGGLVAAWLAHAESREDRFAFRIPFATLQWLGVALIGIAIWQFDESTPWPGGWAAVPVLGAALLLAGGALARESRLSRILSAKPLVWLGGVSYAWYLWHWPLVGLASVLKPDAGVGGKLAWSAAALALAWATHALLEQRVRRTRWSSASPHLIAGVSLAASIVAALIALAAVNAANRATASGSQRAFAAAREDRVNHPCWINTVREIDRTCEFGDKSSPTVIALLGDSHAEHWLAALDRIGRERKWKIVTFVKGGCPAAELPAITGKRAKYYAECRVFREESIRRAIAMRPAAVILSSWDHYIPADGSPSTWQVSDQTWRDGLRRVYRRFTAAHIRTIAFRDVPQTPFDVPACLSRRAAELPFAGSCEYTLAATLSRPGINAQNAAARGLPVRIIDMNDQVCQTSPCGSMAGSTIIFTDDNHLTATFSRTTAPVLGARIAEAMR